MQITGLERIDARKCRVYLNDEPAFWLYNSEISRYKIREGQPFSPALEAEIYGEVLPKRAKLRCLNLLKLRDKTEMELIRKLRLEEYPEEVIIQAVEYVKSYRYVDDLRYAKNYIEYKRDTKSPQQIRYELQGRGVAENLISQAFEEAESVDVTAQILRWAEKKHFDIETKDTKERQKFYSFLLRKGFLYSEIKKALT